MSAGSAELRVRFWGVRGSAPAPSASMLRYGGHTACLQIALSDRRHIVLDAGTGIRPLGERILAAAPDGAHDIFLFLTHYHMDHLLGLPFFPHLHQARATLTIHGHRPAGESLRALLERFVSPPFFPAPLATRPSTRIWREIAREPVEVDDIVLTPVPLRHPDGATGWRIVRGGRSILYATDFEPGDAAGDEALLAAAAGVDVLVADAHFTPAERAGHPGWGHGSWAEAAELARRAAAGRLVLFHHHPGRTDAEIDAIVREAREIFPATDAAREGMEIVP